MPLTPDQLSDAYRQMHVIRKFEETIRRLYERSQIRGSFHPCVGQEATAVGGCLALRRDDYVTCTYRGHGVALAKGLSVRAGLAEMLGKRTGCSKGKGGSMHFTDLEAGLLGANAIVAAGIPHAAGAALAAQMQGRDTVALTYFGEGAVHQGVFHEALNLAAVWKLPLILLCENNLYSEMTPIHETSSVASMVRRGEAYQIPSVQIDGNDLEAVHAAVAEAVARARAGEGPTFIEAMTYRLWGHMMGDPQVYRTKQEVTDAWQTEPIVRLGQRLLTLGCTPADLARLEAEADATLADGLEFAEASPVPSPEEALLDVFA